MKVRKSITIDSNISRQIEKQAGVETRSFSNLIEKIAKKYLSLLKVSCIKDCGDTKPSDGRDNFCLNCGSSIVNS